MAGFINNLFLKQIKKHTITNIKKLSISVPRILDEHGKSTRGISKVLDACDEDQVAHVAPFLKPTFNFAAYINKSETLQELMKLGVDLHKLEKKPNVPEFILGLQFENDIKEHVMFLYDMGLKVEDIGVFITKNPFVFKESIENLKVRINYLESKHFTSEMIARIIGNNPLWLSLSTRDIDNKLGFLQQCFSLSGNEVRTLATKQPRLITYSPQHIKQSIFMMKEEMGFTPQEYKKILLDKPRIFMNDHKKVLKTFEYLHNTMKISLETIVQMPEVLSCRQFRLQQRFEYLKLLNKVQFNPKQPGYISPAIIATGSDVEFCSEVAQTSIQSYNTFLKTL